MPSVGRSATDSSDSVTPKVTHVSLSLTIFHRIREIHLPRLNVHSPFKCFSFLFAIAARWLHGCEIKQSWYHQSHFLPHRKPRNESQKQNEAWSIAIKGLIQGKLRLTPLIIQETIIRSLREIWKSMAITTTVFPGVTHM